ncbi:hypothetical protein PPSIR1_23314 [Plesiocystis pacifica SIR-1]|uniref:Uncharacterized protein n=1 Tax=Plesiocystis pacifica SIR-1 TaxID=391625 RepID=A6GC87_9BACT|nr:hypothetical protein [Plesiocystis pacifica]EDM76536.1 hypothetical protein PPSIR1_23314 [Plesiocystis pacifica SIR-1]
MTRSVELLRARREPRMGAEDRILAQLEATVGGTPDGGGSDGAGPQGGAGSGGAGAGPLYAAKIVLATATLTALGLGALRLGAVLLGPSPAPSPARSARAEAPPPATAPALTPTEAPVDAAPSSQPVADESERPPASVHGNAKASTPPRTAPEDSGTSANADAVAAELALIEAARAAEGPRAVIERLEAHAREFPEGLLADERELLWTLADCERGQLDAATTRARSFIERRPSSPLVDRMLHACPELEARMTKADQAGHG